MLTGERPETLTVQHDKGRTPGHTASTLYIRLLLAQPESFLSAKDRQVQQQSLTRTKD